MLRYTDNTTFLNSFASFAKDIEFHKDTTYVFFNDHLLFLLDKNFGYHDGVIIARDKEKRYIGGVGNERTNIILSEYVNGFHKKDTLSRYINQNRRELLRTAVPIVRVTDLITEDYENSEYATFLKHAGLQYAVALVFSSHTLCLYKDCGDEDFSDSEIELLNCIYSVIRYMDQRFLVLQSRNLNTSIKAKIFENFKVGYMIYDELGNPLEHNDFAIQYVTEIFGKQNLNQIFSEFCGLFKNSDETLQQFHEYSIGMERILNVDSFGQVRTYYYIVIAKVQAGALPAKSLDGFASLSSRELEVLDAFCHGANYSEIAAQLYISENTVRSHLKSIYRKLDVSNQRSLLRLYFQYEASSNG